MTWLRALAVALAALAILACRMPTAPEGEWRMVEVCTLTIGQAVTCGNWQRCWLTYQPRVFHCPSGDYPVASDVQAQP